jgi:hypothetical protein
MTASPSHRWFRFSLRTLIAMVTATSAGFAFLHWQEWSVRAWIWLLLIVVVPASVVIERLFSRSSTKEAQSTRRSFLIGSLWLIVCGHFLAALIWFSLFASGVAHVPTPLMPVAFIPVLEWLRFVHDSKIWEVISFVCIPAGMFLIANAFVSTKCWPRPIPLRLPVLAAIFSLLSVAYCVADWSLAVTAVGLPTLAGWYAIDLLAAALIFGLWWWWRHCASRVTVLLLALLLHSWVWTLAFPSLGGLLVDEFFKLDLTGAFHAGPAPPIDLKGWE